MVNQLISIFTLQFFLFTSVFSHSSLLAAYKKMDQIASVQTILKSSEIKKIESAMNKIIKKLEGKSYQEQALFMNKKIKQKASLNKKFAKRASKLKDEKLKKIMIKFNKRTTRNKFSSLEKFKYALQKSTSDEFFNRSVAQFNQDVHESGMTYLEYFQSAKDELKSSKALAAYNDNSGSGEIWLISAGVVALILLAIGIPIIGLILGYILLIGLAVVIVAGLIDFLFYDDPRY